MGWASACGLRGLDAPLRPQKDGGHFGLKIYIFLETWKKVKPSNPWKWLWLESQSDKHVAFSEKHTLLGSPFYSVSGQSKKSNNHQSRTPTSIKHRCSTASMFM